jgi:ankyrin repeat protein
MDLVNIRDKYTNETVLHFCAFNGHADLIEKLIENDNDLIDWVDDDKNTAFHSLCKNSVSCTEDLIYMHNVLKKYNLKRKAFNNKNQTGLDILQDRIKSGNPYDWNIQATHGLFNYLASSKRKSLMTTYSWPQNERKRFSGVSVVSLFKKEN